VPLDASLPVSRPHATRPYGSTTHTNTFEERFAAFAAAHGKARPWRPLMNSRTVCSPRRNSIRTQQVSRFTFDASRHVPCPACGAYAFRDLRPEVFP